MVSMRKQSAFSLVELSIVLVILGLLVGGVLSGQALIRAAELRAVGTEYQRWATATQTFRDKYFALPGDFREATRFWSRMNSNVDCVTSASMGVNTPGVCDGDGDGLIEWGSPNQSSETFQFWRHLAISGLIEGEYTGTAGPVNAWHEALRFNIPSSRMSRTGWRVQNYGLYGDAWFYLINYGNYLSFGRVTSNPLTCGGCSHFMDAVLRPEEAWSIDNKIDDGRPAQGNVISTHWNNICASADDGSSTNDDLSASYRVSATSASCSLIFKGMM